VLEILSAELHTRQWQLGDHSKYQLVERDPICASTASAAMSGLSREVNCADLEQISDSAYRATSRMPAVPHWRIFAVLGVAAISEVDN
jgi:hypothetical protein